MKKVISLLIYCAGIICVCFYGFVVLSHNETVQNPMAMLPFMEYETAFCMLAFGAVPMCLSCYFMYMAFDLKKTEHKKRNFFLIFIPSIPCILCCLYIVVLILIILLMGYRDAFAGIFSLLF